MLKLKKVITYKEVDIFFNEYYNAPSENRDLKVNCIINAVNREYKDF